MRLPILACIVATVGACSSGAPAIPHPADASAGRDTGFDVAAASDTSVPAPDRAVADTPHDIGPSDGRPASDAKIVTDDAPVIYCVMAGAGNGIPISNWFAGSPYGIGQLVANLNHGFTCLGDPGGPYRLQCINAQYEPGLPGGPWMQAWRDEGQCAPCSMFVPCRDDGGSWFPPYQP
jgi:hypothetical protein